jgi:hypothetical protein
MLMDSKISIQLSIFRTLIFLSITYGIQYNHKKYFLARTHTHTHTHKLFLTFALPNCLSTLSVLSLYTLLPFWAPFITESAANYLYMYLLLFGSMVITIYANVSLISITCYLFLECCSLHFCFPTFIHPQMSIYWNISLFQIPPPVLTSLNGNY